MKHGVESEATPPHAPTNRREHRQRTDRTLVIGGFALMFVVGGALVWRFFGLGAMFSSWLCLGGGVVLFGGIYLLLKLMERWANSDQG